MFAIAGGGLDERGLGFGRFSQTRLRVLREGIPSTTIPRRIAAPLLAFGREIKIQGKVALCGTCVSYRRLHALVPVPKAVGTRYLGP